MYIDCCERFIEQMCIIFETNTVVVVVVVVVFNHYMDTQH